MVQLPSKDGLLPINTSLLALAPLTTLDAEEFFEAVQSCRDYLAKYDDAYGQFLTVDVVRSTCVDAMKRWKSGNAAHFAVRRAGDQTFLGSVILGEISAEKASAALSYWTRADASGQGYAPEAAGEILTWGFTRCGLRRIEARVHVENYSSIRVLEKLRFEAESTVQESCGGRLVDYCIYKRLAA